MWRLLWVRALVVSPQGIALQTRWSRLSDMFLQELIQVCRVLVVQYNTNGLILQARANQLHDTRITQTSQMFRLLTELLLDAIRCTWPKRRHSNQTRAVCCVWKMKSERLIGMINWRCWESTAKQTNRQTHVSPFVSHKCNSPNMPQPSFSTMTNLSRGNSLSTGVSSMRSVSNSLYELRWWLSGVVGVMQPVRPSNVAVEFDPLLFELLWLLLVLWPIVFEPKRCPPPPTPTPFIVPVLQICVAA